MSLHHTFLSPRRVLATAFSFLAVAVASQAGEPIRFSKPAVPLASPVKEQASLPEPRTRGIEFASPDVERPMIAPPIQQPVVRVERRDEKEEGLHWLLRTPAIFSDPDEQKLSSDPARNSKLPLSAFSRLPKSSDMFGGTKPESALSPVTDSNWDGRDPNGQSNDARDARAPKKGDRNNGRSRNPFLAQDDSDSKFDTVGRPSSLRDLFTSHHKEKPTALQIERRAAFQQLLNPNAENDGKIPSSLQPVVSATDVKPGALGIPTVGGNNGLTPRNSDPMAAFNRQHDRLRGPVMDDINKKYSSQPTPPTRGASLDPSLPQPLNRQPAMHDFPSRKF